jgi:hypothetical protein
MRWGQGLLVSTLLWVGGAQAQVTLSGQIVDQQDGQPIVGAMVTINRYQSSQLLTYTQTDTAGRYVLKLDAKVPALTLRARSYGYQTYEREIVLGGNAEQAIKLSMALPRKGDTLAAVVIEERPSPIIVKPDTVIYDVGHWQETGDQTLETVLARIPGFQVQPNGDLIINGKRVDKVLVDGEEVTGDGAALLTRSLSPEDVEAVELRTDEQNRMLKQSLIDTDELVVLDIKLKEEVQKSLFGKARLTAGQQAQPQPGGYVNAFSLRPKLKAHMFAEHDRFGNQEISLYQVRNLGREALAELFSTPADFASLTQRKEFNKEIYGFKDYVETANSIIGFTMRVPIGSAWKLNLGSYTSYKQDSMALGSEQVFEALSLRNRLSEAQRVANLSSKNKLELTFDQRRVKVRIDLNLVHNRERYQNFTADSTAGLTYQYRRRMHAWEWYQNGFFEYKFSDQWGIQVNTALGYVSSDRRRRLMHNDPSYARYLMRPDSSLIGDFEQQTAAEARSAMIDGFVQRRGNLGTYRIGTQWQGSDLLGGKQARALSDGLPLPASSFTGQSPRLIHQRLRPYLRYETFLGEWGGLSQQVGWAILSYPLADATPQTASLLEWESELTLHVPVYMVLTWLRRTSAFPLRQLLPGDDLLAARTIGRPGRHTFTPRPEQVLQLTFDHDFTAYDVNLFGVVVYGRTQQGDLFRFDQAPIVEVQYQQLLEDYWLGEIQATHTFKAAPLTLSWVQSYLRNRANNQLENHTEYATATVRWLTELNVRSAFKDQWYDFHLHGKHSWFQFINSLAPQPTTQRMITLDLRAKFDLWRGRLLLRPGCRQVFFQGTSRASLLNPNLRIEAPLQQWFIFLEADNLLDNQAFIRQQLTPAWLRTDIQEVFGRYVKVGLAYRFR